jgi:hypothetical protein
MSPKNPGFARFIDADSLARVSVDGLIPRFHAAIFVRALGVWWEPFFIALSR